VIHKSYIVEKDFKIIAKYRSVLLYGVNDGIKDDIKSKLKLINKESGVINFFENEIIKNKNLLYENIINESLFNEKKIIFIQSATDKIFNEISESLDKKNLNIKIYIFSDNLDKRSKLRSLYEKEKELGIIACYEDNERTLINYINQELTEFKGLSGELINLIISNSNANRKVIQSEITKIKTFFLDKLINKNQLLEILNIKNNADFDEIRDNVLIGRKEKINKLLSEFDLLHEDSFFYLNNLNYRILKLTEIQKNNKNLDNYIKTIEDAKPPIFWKDRPIFLEQLKKWDLKKLNKAAYKINETETLMKKNSQIRNDVIIKNLLISLSKEDF
jgi:DNA polymerase-3 subunit delta